MQLNQRFYEVFGKKPVIGMIHLAGENPVRRALQEIKIYAEEGIDGALIEDYHGTIDDVVETLKLVSQMETGLAIGVNILHEEDNFEKSMPLAAEYKADFVQLDYVAGKYTRAELNFEKYAKVKEQYPHIIVMGGVWPKYYTAVPGSYLKKDIEEGMKRAEAIVVTGRATGMATPFEKILRFREILGSHILGVGAGLTPANAYEQMRIADFAIIGSAFKEDSDTFKIVSRPKIREIMPEIEKARNEEKKL